MAKPKSWGTKEGHARPDGQIRRSQLVTSFGPGALVDLVDAAVLVGGLEFWRIEGGGSRVIQDPRLRDAVAAKLPKEGPVLSFEEAFLEPPEGDDKQPMKMRGIESLEFPQWFVCQSCRALTRTSALELSNKRYRHQCNRSDRGECVPVRFVGACALGHVQDYPWVGFVHSAEKPRCESPELKLREGATGDFSEVVVRCESCRQEQKLSRTLAKDASPQCDGERPWLGKQGREPCSEPLRLLVRTASNAYFSQVESALSVPDVTRALDDAVQTVWDVLKDATSETLPVFRTIAKVKAKLAGYDDTEVLGAIQRLRGDSSAPREKIRVAEYRQLATAKLEAPGDLPKDADGYFHARTAVREKGLPERISKVVLVDRLREVRVQVGFTRLTPASSNVYGELEDVARIARLTLQKTWLPACEIHGEGIFIELDEKAVQEWESRESVRAREMELRLGFARWAADAKVEADPYPARFYLLHSLAHLLSSAISLECGYAASSIAERIYCSRPGDSFPMAAILLSTGTPGTEGTLGGLVEEGRRLRLHLRRAFEMGTLCSNDPVCASHQPNDEAERWLEGAACHGCLFVAECSCERFNRYLDRALVVPTIGHAKDRAFFQERP